MNDELKKALLVLAGGIFLLLISYFYFYKNK